MKNVNFLTKIDSDYEIMRKIEFLIIFIPKLVYQNYSKEFYFYILNI